MSSHSLGLRPRNSPIALLLSALLLAPCMAGRGAGLPVLLVDLDGDGRAERIELARVGSKPDLGEFYRLVVRRSDATILWQSPETLATEHPLAFGAWDFGESLPQLAHDIDRDGRIELVAPAPQSDVSPTSFRVLRWEAGEFRPAWNASFLARADAPDQFLRQEEPPPSGRWIAEFVGLGNADTLLVNITSYEGGDAGTLAQGSAEVRWNGAGFAVARWISPLAPPPATPADVTPQASGAQTIRYRARLSPRDHLNSRGTPLDSVAEILRQDRANFHRFHAGDQEDQPDPAFHEARARDWLAAAPVISADPPGWEDRIRGGTPLVEVESDPARGATRVRILAP